MAKKLRLSRPSIRMFDHRVVKPLSKKKDAELYRAAWRRLRDEHLAAHPACQSPDHDPQRPRIVPRMVADHVQERRDAPELFLEHDNLQTLCPSCHMRKTLKARAARMGQKF
jgi:5-methylcytosine-specific restriction protein A